LASSPVIRPLEVTDDDDTAAALDNRDFLGVDVVAAARLAHALDLGDAGVFVFAIDVMSGLADAQVSQQ
jgi:hypothetical protein